MGRTFILGPNKPKMYQLPISDVRDVPVGGQQEPGGDAGRDGEASSCYGRSTCLVNNLNMMPKLVLGEHDAQNDVIVAG